MAPQGNAYSRFIALAKIGLPLAALALLSTLFLFSRDVDPDGPMPYADVDIDELVRDQRVTAPSYTGVTADGAAIAVSADSARPDPTAPGGAVARGLTARLDFPGGGTAQLTATEGTLDASARRATLSGGVVIDTPAGYRVEAEGLKAALDRTDLRSTGPVIATGPPGRLSAGAMELSTAPEDGGGYLLVFKDGVKLVYDPKN